MIIPNLVNSAGKRFAVRPGFAAFLFVGMVASTYMTYEGFHYLRTGTVGRQLCSVSPRINCQASVASDYAFFLGVPVAWLGLLFFVSIVLLGAMAVGLPRHRSAVLGARSMLCFAGAAVSLWMLAVMIFKLRVLCLPCLMIQIACFGIAALSLPYTNSLYQLKTRFQTVVWAAAILIFYAGGLNSALALRDGLLETTPVNVAEELRQHFSSNRAIDPASVRALAREKADGKIQVACFVDYQCPECRRVALFLPSWLGDRARCCSIIDLQFPLDSTVNPYKPHGTHLQAGIGAKAALCFQFLGASPTLERRLFRFQSNLCLTNVLDLARSAGLETNSFLEMMRSSNVVVALKRQMDLAHISGVSATPTVFIAGRKVAAYDNQKVLQAIIDAEARRQKPGPAWVSE